MQDIMDKYAGGISTYYAFTEDSLNIAEEKINALIEKSNSASCNGMQDLTHFLEVKERLTVCLSVIAHLRARKETRWHCFAENESYPNQDDKNYLKYINSKLVNGQIKIIERPLADRRGNYEYQN
jgi:adenylylsulfate reductase subunit A